MGRRKGSLNKPKEDAEEAAPPPILTDQERWALTAQHAKSYEIAKEAVRVASEVKREADADLKLVVKLAEQEGVPLSDIKAWNEASTAEGQAKMKAQADLLARMARWFNFKLGHQPDIFDEGPAPMANRSSRLGYEAGVAGEPPKPPENCDINAWMSAWQLGQAKKLGEMKNLGEAA